MSVNKVLLTYFCHSALIVRILLQYTLIVLNFNLKALSVLLEVIKMHIYLMHFKSLHLDFSSVKKMRIVAVYL